MNKKKIAIYHPNMHNMGGGETVALNIASSLQNENEVTIFVTKKISIEKLERFFGINLKNVNFKKFGRCIGSIPYFHTLKPSLLARSMYSKLDNYDIVIDTCTNGIFERKVGKKSICYVHFPNFFAQKKGIKSILNSFIIRKENMFNYDTIICNSEFTQEHVKKIIKKKTQIIYPPVKTEHIKPKKKKNLIITIGRYSPEKKLEVLIDAFIKGDFKEYEFHIVGASGSESYFNELQRKAKGRKIVFHKDVPHKGVLSMLETAKYYWHSRGYGETDPVEFENFGITTAEAIAAGCIPLVINLGAQPEIIKKVGVGAVWNTPEELIKKTKKITALNKRPKNIFSVRRFEKEITSLL